MAKHNFLFCAGVLLFFLGNSVKAEDLQCPNNLTATSTLRRLKKDIFCSYDRSVRPVRQHNDTVNVKLFLRVRRLDFDDKKDMLTIHSWFDVKWDDYHFVWNPAKYENVAELTMINYYFWNPDIAIYSTADEETSTPFMRLSMCIITNKGTVNCVSSVNHVTSCSADLTRWPYDTHKCALLLGSWTYYGEHVNVSTDQTSADPLANANREWKLVSTNFSTVISKFDCCPNETYPHVRYEFVLQRHSGVYAATVILPAVVMMILTLTTFWMNDDYPDRLILVVVNLLSHFLFLHYLGDLLPSNGDKTPMMMTFFRDSLFLTAVALLIALCVNKLRNSSRALPVWVSGVSTWIVQNRLGQVLIFHNLNPKGSSTASEAPRGDAASLDGTAIGAPTIGWDTFTLLLDVVGFFVTLLVYFILLLGFIP